MTRYAAAGSFEPIRPEEQDYFAFDFNLEVGYPISFTGFIEADVLTVTSVITGPVLAGLVLTGESVVPGTMITDKIDAVGGAGTYHVNHAQTVPPNTNMQGVGVVSSAAWSCVVSEYSAQPDPTPQARLLTDPPNVFNNVTTCLIGGMIDGVTYLLTTTATVSDGRQLVTTADVMCQTPATIIVADQYLSVPEFRAAFPAFSNTQIYSDATVAFWLNRAQTMPVIDADRWGQFYQFGIGLWTAHILTLGGAMGSRGGPMIGSGVPGSKSVGGVSISYDNSIGQEQDAGWYALTPYGNAFLRYLRMAGAGPIQVGTGVLFGGPGSLVFMPRPW
jgi:hypothetical protein